MGSVLSSAHAALCSLVDKVMMRRLMASFPHPPGMTEEEVEASLRWLLDTHKREDPPHPDAPPQSPKLGVRCNFRHPCYRVDDKSKNTKLAEDVSLSDRQAVDSLHS